MSKRFEELWAKANTQWAEEFEQAAEPRMCRTARDIFAELVWQAAYEEGHDAGVDAGFEAGRNASFTEQNFGVEE